jgi:phosphatidylglycerophosphatase A
MKAFFTPDKEMRRIALATPSGFFAFGFGAGLIRIAPGTMGTLVAIPLALVCKSLPPAWFWLVLTLGFVAGVYWCQRVTDRLGIEDSGGIVWDEIIGFILSVAFIPVQWTWWLAAFILFRAFDILKPPPVGYLDRNIKGGLGVMLDDVAAGFYTLLTLELIRWIID